MAYGLQVFDTLGNVTFDSNVALHGCLIETVTYGGGAGPTKTYPNYAGRTLVVNTILGDPAELNNAVDYALGYPRVVFSGGAAITYSFAVFVA